MSLSSGTTMLGPLPGVGGVGGFLVRTLVVIEYLVVGVDIDGQVSLRDGCVNVHSGEHDVAGRVRQLAVVEAVSNLVVVARLDIGVSLELLVLAALNSAGERGNESVAALYVCEVCGTSLVFGEVDRCAVESSDIRFLIESSKMIDTRTLASLQTTVETSVISFFLTSKSCEPSK